VKSTFGVVSVVGVALVAAACGSDSTSPKKPVGPDASCVVGTLTVGTTATGTLSGATSSCSYPLWWDSSVTTLNVSYNFGVQSGKGYLVSLLASWDNHLELIGKVGTTPTGVEFSDYWGPRQSSLPFIATSTTAYSVRVGQDDNSGLASDTGAYSVQTQSCKVPVPTITDSVTHSDNLAPGDCVVPYGDFGSQDSSYVHLYAIHFDSGASRTIYLPSPSNNLAFDLGGPGFDPWGYYSTSVWASYTNISGGQGTFTANHPGTYTMVIGTAAYQAGSTSYTITIGNQVLPGPLHVTPPPGLSASAFGLSNISIVKPGKHGR
jgi:hypothetical protein